MAEHINTNNEQVTIQEVKSGPFEGETVLTLYDGPLDKKVSILLDIGTQDFLLNAIHAIQKGA